MTAAAHAAPTNLDRTREAWLRVATARMSKEIEEVSGIVLPDVRISMGFGGRRYERGVAGVCWARSQDAQGLNQIFISPEIGDMIRNAAGVLKAAEGAEVGLIPATVIILLSLRHELIHAALDNEDKHAKRFAEYATRLGYDAPFAYLAPSPGLVDEMTFLALELGDFPHAKLTVKADVPAEAPTTGGGATTITSAGGSDRNRWVSVRCPHHGRPWRASQRAQDEGLPYCGVKDAQGVPCLTEMVRKVRKS